MPHRLRLAWWRLKYAAIGLLWRFQYRTTSKQVLRDAVMLLDEELLELRYKHLNLELKFELLKEEWEDEKLYIRDELNNALLHLDGAVVGMTYERDTIFEELDELNHKVSQLVPQPSNGFAEYDDEEEYV